MGFFKTSNKEKKSDDLSTQSVAFLHKHQCQVCPLNNQKQLLHPHMPAYGTEHPVLYFCGEAPGKEEDKKGIPFVGPAGRLLRKHIPKKWEDKIRWNNVCRTRPPNNRTPTPTEIEACRPSTFGDVETSKPKAVFGFGNIPLYWAIGKESGITNWCGRKIPVRFGEHVCWFFPMLHPSSILHLEFPKNEEQEFVLDLNLRNAFDQIETLEEPEVHTPAMAQLDIDIITGSESGALEQVISFIRMCYDYKTVGIDYETKKLRPYAKDAKILTVSLSHKDGTLAFPFDHPGSKFKPNQIQKIKDEFEKFLYNAPCEKISHQLPFEMEWTGFHFGKEALRAQPWHDTVTESYILDEREGTHSLDFLCLQYFGLNLKAISNLDTNNLETEHLDLVLKYNGLDAKYHRLLHYKQIKEIKRQNLMEVYENFRARIPTMVLTQLKGIPVNQETVGRFYNHFRGMLDDTAHSINKIPEVRQYEKQTGKTFRPLSNPDVQEVLKKHFNEFPDSVDEKALEQIDNDFTKLILDYRGYNKKLSTYIIPYMKPEDAETLGEDASKSCVYPDGRIHTQIATTRTRTSRTSSNEPNTQNVPKHEEDDPNFKLRSQIQHKNPDIKIVAFDYAGIQARNVAMESLDDNLIDAFWKGYDIHTDWAEQIVELWPKWIEEGVKEFVHNKDVRQKYRQRSKNEFVFASFFGAQPPKTSRALGIPEEKTRILYKRFWTRFPQIKDWHDSLKVFYNKHGYITGKSGFRRRAPVSINEQVNSPIQADETIIVCSAMARLSEMQDTRYQASLEIHDDLTFLWPKKSIEKNAEVVTKEMTRLAFPWMSVVPIVVEMSVGNDWASTKRVTDYSSIDIWGHKR